MKALLLATLCIWHHTLEEASRTNCRDSTGTKACTTALFCGAAFGRGALQPWNGHSRSPMQFAVSHDAVSSEQLAERYEPSPAKRQRVATTATLLGLVLCAFMAKGHVLAAPTSRVAVAVAAQDNVKAPVTIVAPEFCKDQTWPYIDSRCLRRVDNPPPDSPQSTVAPATTAAATPAASAASGNTVATSPPSAATVAAQTNVITNAPPAAAPPKPTDTRNQVMQSAFPSAASDIRTYPATNAYTRTVNA